MENWILYAAGIVAALVIGFALRAWLARSKTDDLEAEMIKIVGMQVSALAKVGNEDEIIAAAEARKAAKAVAIAALKAKVAAL